MDYQVATVGSLKTLHNNSKVKSFCKPGLTQAESGTQTLNVSIYYVKFIATAENFFQKVGLSTFNTVWRFQQFWPLKPSPEQGQRNVEGYVKEIVLILLLYFAKKHVEI